MKTDRLFQQVTAARRVMESIERLPAKDQREVIARIQSHIQQKEKAHASR